MIVSLLILIISVLVPNLSFRFIGARYRSLKSTLRYSFTSKPMHGQNSHGVSPMQAEAANDGVYWNPELGIWQDIDGKACVKVLKELDAGEPLYVFGYGSLIWRPGDLLERYPSYDVDALAYQRLFAQRSYDHRGTPRFPGLVLTVHPLEGMEGDAGNDKQAPSTCSGRVFLVPEEDREKVMEELDFREKGGYTRTVMEVRMRAGQENAPYAAGDVFRTIVYYAERSNPLFFDGAAELSEKGVQATANIIAASEGPSGHNSAYLLQLSHYLYYNSPSLTDHYLISLSRCVYYRSCPWHLYSRGLMEVAEHCIDDPLSLLGFDTSSGEEEEGVKSDALLGWGSNEYSQLRADPEISGKALARAAAVDVMEHPYRADSVMLVAGGGSSGLLDRKSGQLSVWGQLGNFTFQDVRAACMGHAHGLALHRSGKLFSFGEDSHGQCSKVPSHLRHVEASQEQGQEQDIGSMVSKAACGLRHSAAIDRLGRLHTWGAGKHGQVLEEQEHGISPPPLPQRDGDPLEPCFVDVACGARHTLAVDNRGDIWGFGDNRHGILGVEDSGAGSGGNSLVLIGGLPSEVKWVSIKSGWAHAVATGVRQDGSLVFHCWGRCDMHQLPSVPLTTGEGPGRTSKSLAPSPLLPLPIKKSGAARATVGVWCGAEHTVAADSEGYLWVSGWDDHSGTQEGDDPDQSEGSGWRAVLEEGYHARARLTHGTVASSSVATGGAHSLFISGSSG